MRKANDQITGCVCAVACETIFGLSYLFTKDATSAAAPLALLGWRFVSAFVLLAMPAALGVVKVNFHGKPRRRLLAVALASPLMYFIGETYGIAATTASESGAFLSSIPVACLIASSLLLKKPPSRRQAIGIAVTLAGVLITVFAASCSADFSPSGYAFLLLAVSGYALYSVFVAKATEFSGAEITLAMLAAGALFFGTAAVLEAAVAGELPELLRLPLADGAFLRAVLFQSVGCSIVGFIMSNLAIAKIGVNGIASFIGVSTAAAILSGVLFLGERFSLFQLSGVVLIVTGVGIANRLQMHRRRP